MIEFEQALILTLIGMGMTFAAIGLLVAGMYAMTALIKDKQDAVAPHEPASGPSPMAYKPAHEPVHNAPNVAAAAAVATMLAEQQGKVQAAAAATAVAVARAQVQQVPTSSSPTMTPGAWNTAVRIQRLAQRRYHDSRRRKI